jgi:hypothetical protein
MLRKIETIDDPEAPVASNVAEGERSNGDKIQADEAAECSTPRF